MGSITIYITSDDQTHFNLLFSFLWCVPYFQRIFIQSLFWETQVSIIHIVTKLWFRKALTFRDGTICTSTNSVESEQTAPKVQSIGFCTFCLLSEICDIMSEIWIQDFKFWNNWSKRLPNSLRNSG